MQTFLIYLTETWTDQPHFLFMKLSSLAIGMVIGLVVGGAESIGGDVAISFFR